MKNTIFVVMPFSNEVAESVYTYSTRPVAQSLGFDIQRGDEIFSTNPIFDDIVTAIEQSSLVIVDISGRNANCFYELGVSHTLKRNRTIMITQDDFKDVPFDVAHFRILRYQNSIQGKVQYEDDLRKMLRSITSGLAELYYPEFDVVIGLLAAMDDDAVVYACQALAISATPIRAGDTFAVEGRNPTGAGSGAGGHIDSHYAPLVDRGIVEVIDGVYSLTSKGSAFVEYVTSRGFKVDSFNEQTFTKDHESFFDRSKRRLNRLNSRPQKQ